MVQFNVSVFASKFNFHKVLSLTLLCQQTKSSERSKSKLVFFFSVKNVRRIDTAPRPKYKNLNLICTQSRIALTATLSTSKPNVYRIGEVS